MTRPPDSNPKDKMPQDWKALMEEEAAVARLAMRRARPLPPPARSMGAAATRALAPILKQAGPAPASLSQRWPEIVGPRLAAVTEPIKVTRSKAGSTLVVRAPSAAAPVIQHAQKDILERVSLATGANVTGLKIVHTEASIATKAAAEQPRALTGAERLAIRQAAEEKAQSPALRDALTALGEAVASWRRPRD
jgi:hypothetical protein